jgi:hypothetical protein
MTVATFGTLAGVEGIVHGIGEMLQGTTAPSEVVIRAWPGSESMRVLDGWLAITVVPNFLVTGVLTIIISLSFLAMVGILVWPTPFVSKKNGGLILVALSIALMLVGGGVGPPLLGIIIGAAGTRIGAPLPRWCECFSTRSQRLLPQVWRCLFVVSLFFWVVLVVGSILAGYLFHSNALSLISMVLLVVVSYALILLTVVTGFAYDTQQQIELNQMLSTDRYRL